MSNHNTSPTIPAPNTGPLPDWIVDRRKSDEQKAAQQAARGEVARERGLGWKLHLNFDPTNPEAVAKIKTFLEQTDPRVVRSFKFGRASDQSGKEATVYVGPKDSAAAIATEIETELGEILLPPEGDALIDDIAFTPNVMGRFEISGVEPDFHQYGGHGIPYLDEHEKSIRRAKIWGGQAVDENSAYQEADRILKDRYGAFYTGTVAQELTA